MIEYYKNKNLESLFYVNKNGLVCQEQWKDIPDYEGIYQASDLGRIKSLDRLVRHRNIYALLKSRIYTISLLNNKYLNVGLNKNGKQRMFLVHRLIALSFIPNPENKPEVNHKGEKPNKLDNRVWMLEWATKKENTEHCDNNKLRNPAKGERVHLAKLTEKEVLEIRAIGKSMSQQKIAVKYNMTPSIIGKILNRKMWKHI